MLRKRAAMQPELYCNNGSQVPGLDCGLNNGPETSSSDTTGLDRPMNQQLDSSPIGYLGQLGKVHRHTFSIVHEEKDDMSETEED